MKIPIIMIQRIIDETTSELITKPKQRAAKAALLFFDCVYKIHRKGVKSR